MICVYINFFKEKLIFEIANQNLDINFEKMAGDAYQFFYLCVTVWAIFLVLYFCWRLEVGIGSLEDKEEA